MEYLIGVGLAVVGVRVHHVWSDLIATASSIRRWSPVG